MVRYLPVADAAAKLAALLKTLGPGDEIAVTDGGRLIARIHPANEVMAPRRPGSCVGMIDIIDDDDAVIQEHFQDHAG